MPKKPERLQPVSVRFNTGDKDLIEWLMQYMGTDNKSEVVRSAVRAYAMHLKAIASRPRVGP